MKTGFGFKGDTVTQSNLDICEILRRIFAFHNPKYPLHLFKILKKIWWNLKDNTLGQYIWYDI